MTRQSISFTTPNNNWLNEQIESEEYASKSEIVNDLIRKARVQQNELDFIREKLIKAEKSGFTDLARGEILAKSKEKLRHNGDL